MNAPAWFFILVWFGWVAVTIAGFLLGQWLSEALASLLLGDSATRVLSLEGRVAVAGIWGYVVALLCGAVSGVALGATQGLLLFAFLKSAGTMEWFLATVLGRTVQWMVIYATGVAMAHIVFHKDAVGVLLLMVIMALIGALSGAALGYPQSQVWQSRTRRPKLWVMVNMVGPIVAGLVIAMTLFVEGQNTIRDATTLLAAGLIAVGSAFALTELLTHPRKRAEWRKMLEWGKTEDYSAVPTEETVLGSQLYAKRPEIPNGPSAMAETASDSRSSSGTR